MPARRQPGLVAGVLTAGLVLSGCTRAVDVPAAPFAADPLCASVVLALPEDLAGLPRLRTGSQATVAWGDPTDPVVLRCGVPPPGPTSDPCVTAEDGTASVDWLEVAGEEDPDGGRPWRFTTYGRSPAVEVLVPASVTSTRSTSFLLDLGPAIATVEQRRSCL